MSLAFAACKEPQQSQSGQTKAPANPQSQEQKDPDDPAPEAQQGKGFSIGSCGSLKVSSAEGSTSVDSPAKLKIGQLVAGRLDEDSASANSHFWRISLAKGDYYFVIDSKRGDGKNSNVGMDLELLTTEGGQEDRIGGTNEIDLRTRGAFKYAVAEAKDYILKATSKFDIQDYQLAVFSEGSIPSPYFSDCPEVKDLSFGKNYEFQIGGEDLRTRATWFLVPFTAGDYQFTLDLALADGKNSNVQGSIEFSEGFGDLTDRVLKINEIDFSAREVATKPFAADKKALIRVTGDHQTYILKAKLKVEKK
jgi:hypothetical protein